MEPATFAAELISRLEKLKLELESRHSLEERLQQIREVMRPRPSPCFRSGRARTMSMRMRVGCLWVCACVWAACACACVACGCAHACELRFYR